MNQDSVLVKVLGLFHGFMEKLSLPAEIATFKINHENLVKAEVDDLSVLGHLNQFIEKATSLKDRYLSLRIPAAENKVEVQASQRTKKMKINPLEETAETSDMNDQDSVLIQVTAGKTEIDRRISAFIQRKQLEVDMLNRREFCNVVNKDSDNEFSCARTDAVFVHRLGQKSHIKATQIENTSTTSEAQALGQTSHVVNLYSPRLENPCPGIEERLHNIERHLSYRPGRPVPLDVYKRLSFLEDRILQLEGLSPEYFWPKIGGSLSGRITDGNTSSSSAIADSTENLSLEAIDERMKSLRHSLSRGRLLS